MHGAPMVIRQRAIQTEDKQQRYSAILDAAERVLANSKDLNMAEVAESAGLAKGTVYLYFPGKEELLLALHERNIGGFFSALFSLLEEPRPVGVDDILALTHVHMVERPLFLPLAARCLGNMGQAVPAAAATAFGQRLGERLARAGAGLERHFSELPPSGGVALLRHSYALILGLWQLSGAEACAISAPLRARAPYNLSYADNLDAALRALWQGTVGAPAAARSAP
jgi:AcrR family transcriptional regulator